MTEDILVEVSPGETRIAFVDKWDRLREFLIERINDRLLWEGVFRGRVAKIERGIGGAFVDIGIGENVFLNRAQGLHEGERLIVQVFREAASGKAPSVRREISIAGRYLVFRPRGTEVQWPKRMKFGRKFEELSSIFEEIDLAQEGWSVRSQAVHAETTALISEMGALRRRWFEAVSRDERETVLLPPPTLIERVLRDRIAGDSVVMLDDRSLFHDLSRFVRENWPDLGKCLAFHDSEEPMFGAYGLEDELESLIEPQVSLPRGGRMTIEPTEAMTVIDVDMGGAGGRRQKDDAVLNVNLSATAEVARQIRLRNIAGLIVVDFINMRQRSHGRKLVEAMRREFRDSPVPVDVLGMTAGGLVEITRRRDGPALNETLMSEITAGTRFSNEYVLCAALRAALRAKGAGGFRLIVSSAVASLLKSSFASAFEETGRRMGGALELVEDQSVSDYCIEVMRRPEK